MHYLSLIYFVSQPLHVSGMFIAHKQRIIRSNLTERNMQASQMFVKRTYF
jgi:hypothetical protein